MKEANEQALVRFQFMEVGLTGKVGLGRGRDDLRLPILERGEKPLPGFKWASLLQDYPDANDKGE